MASIKRWKVLYDSIAAGNGDWIALDVRYDESPVRTIQVELTSTDTIIIQGTTKDVKGTDKSFLTSLATDEIATITTISADGAYTLNGPWTYIRAVKTGTTARAKAWGFV